MAIRKKEKQVLILIPGDESSLVQIYLIGFMGAGKTTVGKLLAEKLTMPFVDLDNLIEKKADLSILSIFERFGENYFRHLETECLKNAAHLSGNIIATGGGIVLSAENRTIMKNSGVTVYLKWQTEILYKRIENSTHRPLLNGINESQLVEYIERMLTQRQPYYEQADIIIDGNEGMIPEEIVELIMQKLPSTIFNRD